eukprot:m.808286 g.808286  ORF g.808286 m.808286 type:complete len:76 (+) comp23381_c1_seq26:5227-5454(+)
MEITHNEYPNNKITRDSKSLVLAMCEFEGMRTHPVLQSDPDTEIPCPHWVLLVQTRADPVAVDEACRGSHCFAVF